MFLFYVLRSPLCPFLNKKSNFHRNEDHTKAFEKIKQEIANLTENAHCDVKHITRIKTDAPHNRVQACLEQLYGKDWKTVYFASQFLYPLEPTYSKNGLELLGVVWALEQYKK